MKTDLHLVRLAGFAAAWIFIVPPAFAQAPKAKGYVCVSVNYRLTGEAPFPACVEDVRCAVRWLRAHAKLSSPAP